MTINVLVELSNRNIDKYFTYNVPNNLTELIKVGIRVKVPFGKQTLEGFVMEINNDTDKELKDVIEVVDKDVILKAKKTKILEKHLEVSVEDSVYETLINLINNDKQ